MDRSDMLTVYASVLLGIIAAQIAPGPNLLAVASVALAQGRSRALCVVAGIGTGVLIWITACAFGIAQLYQASPLFVAMIKFVGGAYFTYIGGKAVLSACFGTLSFIRASEDALTLAGAYKRGLLVVLTNPKAAIMWGGITAFLFGYGLSTFQVSVLAPVGAVSALIVYGGYGLLFSTQSAQSVYQKMAKGLELGFGVLFVMLGVKLLYDVFLAVQI